MSEIFQRTVLPQTLRRIFDDRLYENSGPIEFLELSGWDHPRLAGSTMSFEVSFTDLELSRYVLDYEQPNIEFETIKKNIATHLSLLELGTEINHRQIQLTYGGTGALSLLLHWVKSKGIEMVVADPPFYFSLKHLTKYLNLDLIAAERNILGLHDPKPLLRVLQEHKAIRKAVYIAHPRYVVGGAYSKGEIAEILACLRSDDLLIVDNSINLMIEQDSLSLGDHSTVAVVKTIGKSISMYGCRLAAIVTSEAVRAELNTISEWLFGGYDVGMLRVAHQLTVNHYRFKERVLATRQLVDESYRNVLSKLAAEVVALPKPNSTYLGYALVDTDSIGRYRLYQFFLRNRINAMFSEQIGLARIAGLDLIRINYLLDIDKAVGLLSDFAAQARKKGCFRSAWAHTTLGRKTLSR